jgi:CheY-like chemotaxis protein
MQRVRSPLEEKGGRTPAVALTSYVRAKDPLRALRAAKQMHIPKPVVGEFRKRTDILEVLQFDTIRSMGDIFTLFLHAIVTIIRLAQPGGLRAVVAESILMRHQVLILN